MGKIDTSLLRTDEVLRRRGCEKSQLYREIRSGVMSPGMHKGRRWVVWPAFEIDVLNRAEIAGASLTERKALVHELVRARKDQRESVLADVRDLIAKHTKKPTLRRGGRARPGATA